MILLLLACGWPTQTEKDSDSEPPAFETWCADSDGDGFGDPAACDAAESPPAGFVQDASDCDDTNASVHPGAPEHCDDIDEDCDGVVDNDPVDLSTFYVDADADGFGATPIDACDQPAGSALSGEDCDDTNAAIYPSAPEHCDDIDEDCDGVVDNDPVDLSTFYVDSDADGFGAAPIEACDQPAGSALSGEDCDDTNAAIYPGAAEHCDDIDEDCDGVVDNDPVDPSTFYGDADADGFGASPIEACDQPVGSALSGEDCDDTNAAIYPSAPEHCDDIDEDCDGVVDDDPVDLSTFYVDSDADGFGTEAVAACDQPEGTAATGDDCDDTSAAIYLGAPEHCDDIDEDCNGVVDNDPVDLSTFYVDSDADGFGATPIEACDQPVGSVLIGDDCDDTNAAIYPGAPEHCDDIDEDCDGVVDNAPVDLSTFYVDADADGFGTEAVAACDQPEGTAATGDDCDDDDDEIFPGAPEHCDGHDEDCDGVVDNAPVDLSTFYLDRDADGHGAEAVEMCYRPPGTTVAGDDCDDTNATVYPGAPEHCDAVDEDCDGVIDNDVVEDFPVYPDADGDGFGADAGAELDCAVMSGWSETGGDCDDTNPAISPAAEDACLDGIDSDCDGADETRCGPVGDVSLADAETRIVGNEATWAFGNKLAMVGDIDGDGIGEIGAQIQLTYDVKVATPERGAVLALADVADTISAGIGDETPTGADLDGDGFGEILVGVNQDGDDAGLLIFEGPLASTLTRADAIATIDPTGLSSKLNSAEAIGDNDGDGITDLAVAHVGNVHDDTYGWGENVGQIFVMSGPFSGTSMLTDAVARIHPHVWDESGTFGLSMCATDLDGDGIYDLVGGAPGGVGTLPDALKGGAVYTAFGPFAEDRQLNDGFGGLVDGDALWGWAGTVTPMYAGWDVSCGDMDADGTAEILIGSLDDGGHGPGAVWLVEGTATGAHALADADWSISGTTSAEVVGVSVSLDSDLDADGRADLVVGSYSTAQRGRVAMFYGTALAGAAVMDDADATWLGANDGDYAAMVAGGDDLDADGFDDLLIGAPESDEGGEIGGAIYVIYGG